MLARVFTGDSQDDRFKINFQLQLTQANNYIQNYLIFLFILQMILLYLGDFFSYKICDQ